MTARRLLAVVAAVAALAACGRPEAPAEPAGGQATARRIVTLSPHLGELVFAAGAGAALVGVVEFSDFPAEVRSLPRVGDAFRVDYEAVMALRPDLVLAWTSGNPPQTVQRLRDLGLRVESLEPVALEDIAAHVERIGELAGTRAVAGESAARLRARLEALRAHTPTADEIAVFVQLSERPWFTVTDRHFLGQGLRLCGGRNVFGSLPGITPAVALESIIAAAPEVIVASDMGGGTTPLAGWARWPNVPAVKNGQLHLIDADLLSRPGLRILDGIETLCGTLDQARRVRRRAGSVPVLRLLARPPQDLSAAILAGEDPRNDEEQVR